MTYLNPTQMAAVQHWLPLYLEAERRIGVPWALLAALHYRETNLGSSTARVGGILQFDPPLTGDQVRTYGARYGINDLTSPESDPRTAVLCAAAFVQGKVAALGRPALTPSSSAEACADAAWSYNGRAYGSWQNSPYVNNDPQAGRQMWIRGTVPDIRNPARRVRIDQPDRRPGVLAVMRELRARVAVQANAAPSQPQRPAPAPQAAARAKRVVIADGKGQFFDHTNQRTVLPLADGYSLIVNDTDPDTTWIDVREEVKA